MLSNHPEWSSSNWCLRKIICTASGAKKRELHLMEREFGSDRKDRGEKKTQTIPQIIQRCEETHACPLKGGGAGGCRRRCFALCYPSAPASGHKWICRLTFQGAEQQMISSSKAKDKETKAPGFLLRKHREQTLCCRANTSGGRRANGITSPVCFSG